MHVSNMPEHVGHTLENELSTIPTLDTTIASRVIDPILLERRPRELPPTYNLRVNGLRQL
jgi:hypothetical protein